MIFGSEATHWRSALSQLRFSSGRHIVWVVWTWLADTGYLDSSILINNGTASVRLSTTNRVCASMMAALAGCYSGNLLSFTVMGCAYRFPQSDSPSLRSLFLTFFTTFIMFFFSFAAAWQRPAISPILALRQVDQSRPHRSWFSAASLVVVSVPVIWLCVCCSFCRLRIRSGLYLL